MPITHESTPLLRDVNNTGDLSHHNAEETSEDLLNHEEQTLTGPTPLPLRFLLIMMLIRAMTPVAFEVIFPFVNQMIFELGIVENPEDVGFYSGFIESVFSCMSFIMVMPMSYLADRIGRKPIILWGTLALAMSTASFGISKTLAGMIISRSIGGAAGSVRVATKTVMAECTDKTNQVSEELKMAYRIGQILGLPMGGLLTHPEHKFSLFQTRFWMENPFALPCFVSAALTIVGVVLAYFLLDETLESKKLKNIPARLDNSVTESSNVDMNENIGLKEILTPPVTRLLVSSIIMGLVSDMVSALFPLFLFTPVSSGGMGLDETAIGFQMSGRAFIHIGMLFLYSNFERRFGSTVRFYRVIMSAWPAVVCCMPALNMLARAVGPHSLVTNLAMFAFFILWGFSSFSWTGMTILITDASPSQKALSTLNGLSQLAISLPQAIAPAAATTLYALSIKSHVIGGHLIWVLLFVISCSEALHSLTLKESTRSWRN